MRRAEPVLSRTVAKSDSNWVEVESPFLASEEFCVEFWMKTDSSKHATRIINYSQAPDDWNNNNYEISLRNNPKGVGITGRYLAPARGALIITQHTNAVQLGKWYHVIYERNKSNNVVALMVRGQNDEFLFKTSKVDSTPVMGSAGSPARLRIGRAHTDASNWWYIPPFRGKLDNVQIYNYPKMLITAVEGENEDTFVPYVFDLAHNYPNPFNPSTTIRFVIPQFQRVELIIYDILGRKVKTLVNEELHAGPHVRTWGGANDVGVTVATGVYFYQLTAGDLTKVQKMILVR